jgi:hypothetical protein
MKVNVSKETFPTPIRIGLSSLFSCQRLFILKMQVLLQFHLAQCWFKKIQTLGLVNEYKNKNSEIGKFLRLFFGLHYLKSSDVSDVFAFELFNKMPDDVRVVKFCDYVLDNYISDEALFPPELWASDSASTC